MKFYQSGRSMVEMLGVLAIIGVLSVGAISGYSKAMTKYKLNKQAEAFNLLLANAIQLSRQMPKAQVSQEFYNDLLYKVNLLPDGIRYDETQNVFIDVFGNRISFFGSDGSYGYNWDLYFTLDNTSATFDQCLNLVNIAKNFSSELNRLLREDVGSGGYAGQQLWGDADCLPGAVCLKDLTLDNIYNICAPNKNDDNPTYWFGFLWK